MIERDVPTVVAPRPAAPEWGSDVVAEMLYRLQIPYIALEPGSSFRGLHDSIVNYLGNECPTMILCNHEEVAVAIAHGYYKYSGRMMAAATHSMVGLMHASMTIYGAWCDRAPVLVFGGTGPMDATVRRPWIEWVHTAYAQGELVRDFTKWEHQPASVAEIPEVMLRASQVARLEPRGPVYVCLDIGLQEQRLTAPVALPDVTAFAEPSPLAPDLKAIERTATLLVDAQRPVILLGHANGSQTAWNELVSLAEALGAGVVSDRWSPASFPTAHPLHEGTWYAAGAQLPAHLPAAHALREADVILAINKIDVAGAMRERSGAPVHLVNVTLEPFAVRSWAGDYQELPCAEITILANAERTITALARAVATLLGDAPDARRRAEDRAKQLGDRSRERRAEWIAVNKKRWDDRPIFIARTLTELRGALGVRADAAVIAQGPIAPWPVATWDFTTPTSFLGHDGGVGIGAGSGLSVGVALAAIGSGRPVIAVLGDGEMLAAPTALWTAAHHKIPVMFVIANNQSYYNDEEHQDKIAVVRGRARENRWVGQRMDSPGVDFAGLARDLGAEGFGPIEDPSELGDVFRTALAAMDEGRPVLVDVRMVTR